MGSGPGLKDEERDEGMEGSSSSAGRRQKTAGSERGTERLSKERSS